MAKICLITPGQPSTNPRLVKEADALHEAGYEVQVICAHWAAWADDADKVLLESRRWSCEYVGGHSTSARLPYRWSRLRHGLARHFVVKGVAPKLLAEIASSRVLPELMRAAKATRADLYIAHNLAALPPALAAAQKYGAKVGFDAEDFHSGQEESSKARELVELIERKYLPQCDYLTAGSPQIAEAYTEKYQIPTPLSILNVFPLAERPCEFRSAVAREPLTLYWFSQTIGAKRGLEDVVNAMGMLPQCDIELHLRGDWQPGYQKQLRALAKSCGVCEDKIKDYAPAPADEMARLASNYDVGLALEITSNHNRDICLTNKIFTYLLAGNAVIGTATKAQKAFVETIGEAGFCYEPGAVQVLAAQLQRWHNDREALETARRAAWECGTKRYNWDVEKHKFLTVVEKVLKKPSAL